MTLDFGITGIVDAVGEGITISGVISTLNAWGDPTESYTNYVIHGVAQVMDGSEEEVAEGLLDKEDLIMFIDDGETNADKLLNNNYVALSGTVAAKGVYRISNSIHNDGHYEIHAKRVYRT